MQEAVSAWTAQDEFAGIFVSDGGQRAVMSHPPRMQASRAFVAEVEQMLDDSRTTEDVADWIADKMERFGAHFAEPIFDSNGNGPVCSWCKTIWPLCGHHHLSQRVKELEAP